MCLCLLLTGCGRQRDIHMQTVTVFIAGIRAENMYQIEILEDGIIKTTNNFNPSSEYAVNKSKELTKSQCKIVDNMITQVKEYCYDESYLKNTEVDDGINAYAIIDDVKYTCTFDSRDKRNEKLRELIFELLELSPVEVELGLPKRLW